jgi:hypothetical protein
MQCGESVVAVLLHNMRQLQWPSRFSAATAAATTRDGTAVGAQEPLLLGAIDVQGTSIDGVMCCRMLGRPANGL